MGERPGERNQLLLSGGERRTALAHFFAEAAGKGPNKIRQVDFFGGALHVLVGNPIRTQADIAGHCPGKEKGILQHDAEAAAQVVEVHLFDVDAIDADRAFLHVIEAQEQ